MRWKSVYLAIGTIASDAVVNVVNIGDGHNRASVFPDEDTVPTHTFDSCSVLHMLGKETFPDTISNDAKDSSRRENKNPFTERR
jgi:hypothetical protein